MKKVTIGIPVYNDEKYVGKAIESALNQDYGNIEVVIIDDCSTDKTNEICKHYELAHENVKLFHNEENRGIGFNRNACISKSTGDYFCFISSDDKLHFNFVSTMMQHSDKEAFCFSSYNIIDGNDKIKYRFSVPIGLTYDELRAYAMDSATQNTMFCNYSTVFASIDFWKRNMFDESLKRCEDLEHFLRILLVNDERCLAIDNVLVDYRIFPGMGTNRIINEIPTINRGTLIKIKKMLEDKK